MIDLSDSERNSINDLLIKYESKRRPHTEKTKNKISNKMLGNQNNIKLIDFKGDILKTNEVLKKYKISYQTLKKLLKENKDVKLWIK